MEFDRMGVEDVYKRQGVYQAVYGVGMFIGPVAAGWIISALPTAAEGMAANFYANGALSLLGAGLTLLLLRRGD